MWHPRRITSTIPVCMPLRARTEFIGVIVICLRCHISPSSHDIPGGLQLFQQKLMAIQGLMYLLLKSRHGQKNVPQDQVRFCWSVADNVYHVQSLAIPYFAPSTPMSECIVCLGGYKTRKLHHKVYVESSRRPPETEGQSRDGIKT